MVDQGGLYKDKAQGIIARAKAIILTPDAEWPIIDGEPATVGSLYTGYIMILAAIGPISTFLHSVVFGYGGFGITYRPPFFAAVATAIVSYALALGGAYVMALIIDALAPTFQGQKSQVQALKLVAYSSTAAWLAGIFNLIPWIGFLGLLGIYSLYLFYRGLPVMMKCP
ncbi:MAG TPA: Yip1 family protein, partial [Stellaceae bacterium]|nr:Yip1 family protein [Stellaceae bacterium]